jgi:catechol 2,3-dioxygenase-like lactoylglutathione lyase family enzyme
MPLAYLDHVNIRTANLGAMRRFYREVLELDDGDRPPFNFGGAWLYCGDRAAVHLVEVAHQPAGEEPRIEHFAFRAEGLERFVQRLKAAAVPFTVSIVPSTGNTQINVYDPDGNHIEVQFSAGDGPDLSGLAAPR